MTSSLVRFPGPGCVVEFMHGNKAQVAWVLEEQSGKLRLLTMNKREMKLASARILPWAGPTYSGEHTRQQIADILEGHHSRRDAREAEINPLELWELAQGEVDKASIEWFAELLFTAPDVDDVAALGHAMIGCKTHFRFSPPDFEIYPEERVEARKIEEQKREERELLVTQGQDFFLALWDNAVKGKPLGKEPEGELRERLKQVILGRMADPDITISGSTAQATTPRTSGQNSSQRTLPPCRNA
jgi:exoribonuclease-2